MGTLLLAIGAASVWSLLGVGVLFLALTVSIYAFWEDDDGGTDFNKLGAALMIGLTCVIAYVFSGNPDSLVGGLAGFLAPGFWGFVLLYAILGLLNFPLQFFVYLHKSKRKVTNDKSASRYLQRMFDVNYENGGSSGNSKTVTLNKSKLFMWMSSWIIYWPCYILITLLGDLVYEIMHFIADHSYGYLKGVSERVINAALK